MKVGLGGAAVAGAIVLTMTTFGSGVAAADDWAGLTYAKASAAANQYGMKLVIATVTGAALPQDQCVVTRSEKAPWLKGDNFSKVTNTILINLDCNAAVATAGVPGNSAASPEGRAEKEKEAQAVWRATTTWGALWCSENVKAHPNWDFTGCPGWSPPQ
ncbi:hypothetical protein [Mycolicibacterium sphagni]|uniref:hypothetical protein n=1 Tax=Mycolicibacterium sphagni TaxID=1786 RepID=UPI0021F291E9|nr:hypothetical protein [Mycolicibacterium sphagni]MCV7174680.1 hypothetical protein [Mycolicibacterium sphagni]